MFLCSIYSLQVKGCRNPSKITMASLLHCVFKHSKGFLQIGITSWLTEKYPGLVSGSINFTQYWHTNLGERININLTFSFACLRTKTQNSPTELAASSLWIFFSVGIYVGRGAGMGRKTVRKMKPSNWSLMVPVLIRSLWFLNYFFQPLPIPSIQSICNQLIRSPLESYKSIWHFWSLLKPQMEIWCLWRIKKIKGLHFSY